MATINHPFDPAHPSATLLGPAKPLPMVNDHPWTLGVPQPFPPVGQPPAFPTTLRERHGKGL